MMCQFCKSCADVKSMRVAGAFKVVLVCAECLKKNSMWYEENK